MTNEELAEKIQLSDDKNLKTILWKQVKNLLEYKSYKIYKVMESRFSALGIEVCDIIQECYFVFLKAIKAYKPPYAFVTYIEFHFKNMIAKLLNKNTSPYTDSFDEIKDDGNYPLSETISDEKNDIYLLLENRTDSEIIHDEIEKLNSKQKQVIEMYYFKNMTDNEIADFFQNSIVSIGELKYRALTQLRKSPVLIKLYYQPSTYHNKNGFLQPDKFYKKYLT